MIYSRSDWGAAPPKSPLTPGDPADSLVVHHTGGGAAPSSVDDAMAMLRGIQASHQAGEYVDIAYNMAVDQFGNAYILRGMDMLGGATYGANTHTRACVWLGNSDVETPSDAALRAIASLYRSEVGRNLTVDATITGHRDWTATGCPGDTLYGLLDVVRRYAAEQPAPPTPTPTTGEPDMALTIIEPTRRPTQFQGRDVLDLWICGSGVTVGTTGILSAIVIMPADPADAAARPLTVDVHQHQPQTGRSSVQTVTVNPAATTVATDVGGRVSVVFDPTRPVMVHGREVHYGVAR